MCHSPNRPGTAACPVRPPPCGPGGPSHLVWKSSGRAAAAALRLPVNLRAWRTQGSKIRPPKNGEETCSSLFVLVHSILWCVNPQRGALLGACGHRQIQTVSLLIPEAGSRSDRSRYFCQWPVVIGVNLLDDAHEPLSSKCINTFPAGVVIDIVRIGDTGHASDRCPTLCIQHDDLRRLSRHHEKAMIGFVECHRIVSLPGFWRPILSFFLFPIIHHNFPSTAD